MFMGWTLWFLTLNPAFSLQHPEALAKDKRLQRVFFDKDDVVLLQGAPFINTQIVFSRSERIIDVQSGDGGAWTIHINARLPYLLNIKPTLLPSHSDLSVVTLEGERLKLYHFELDSARKKTPFF